MINIQDKKYLSLYLSVCPSLQTLRNELQTLTLVDDCWEFVGKNFKSYITSDESESFTRHSLWIQKKKHTD